MEKSKLSNLLFVAFHFELSLVWHQVVHNDICILPSWVHLSIRIIKVNDGNSCSMELEFVQLGKLLSVFLVEAVGNVQIIYKDRAWGKSDGKEIVACFEMSDITMLGFLVVNFVSNLIGIQIDKVNNYGRI